MQNFALNCHQILEGSARFLRMPTVSYREVCSHLFQYCCSWAAHAVRRLRWAPQYSNRPIFYFFHEFCRILQVPLFRLCVLARRGVAGFLWLGGPDNRGAVGAENSTAEGTLGTPHKFSHRICTNLRGPPDPPWGGGGSESPDPPGQLRLYNFWSQINVTKLNR
jgi:hypothetical protein